MRDVTLLLDGGSRFYGKSPGYEKPVAGEVVLNAAVSDYPKSLTGPSYAGQLLTLTYPLVGNYDVLPFIVKPDGLSAFMESERIHAETIIVSDYSENYSHWNSAENLGDRLEREQVPGITSIDTRELTEMLREHGVMLGRIEFDKESDGKNEESGKVDEELPTAMYEGANYVDRVSCKEIIHHLPDGASTHSSTHSSFLIPHSPLKKVILVGCGVEANIIRCLLQRGVEVIHVPWNYDFDGLEFDELFISNDSGDPDTYDAAVQNICKAMKSEKLPIFGIYMSSQLLSRAGGAKIYKLKYGHHNHNQPVRTVGTGRCFIISQNHGYAVGNNTLMKDWEPLFINMNDGSNEGTHHKRNPWFSTQLHPEAASGPTGTEFLFDEFMKLLK